jgi:hypothetical protein
MVKMQFLQMFLRKELEGLDLVERCYIYDQQLHTTPYLGGLIAVEEVLLFQLLLALLERGSLPKAVILHQILLH